MSDILDRIFEAKAAVLERDQCLEPIDGLLERARARIPDRRPFLRQLQSVSGPALIGEVKRASPSAGLIVRDFDAAAIAQSYQSAGLDAVSVLTESDHFLGELAYLELVRAHCDMPILRKDFLRSRYEVVQSAAYGADAILLIVAALDDDELAGCMKSASELKLDALVEVHDEEELHRAQALGATLIGVNNRNLRTFETDLAVSEYLVPQACTGGATVVSESGVRDASDIVSIFHAGAKAFLVGEALMRSSDRTGFVQRFRHITAGVAL